MTLDELGLALNKSLKVHAGGPVTARCISPGLRRLLSAKL